VGLSAYRSIIRELGISQKKSEAEKNRAIELKDKSMLKDVISATYKGEYKIEIKFEDDAAGVVNFEKYLSKGGVFEKFKDIEFFKNFKIDDEIGVLTWSDEIDIAPETLYAEATGSPMPEWMEEKETDPTNHPYKKRSESGAV
jgi:hypothetical protein